MTAPTTNETDSPIPDDVLAAAIFDRTERSPLGLEDEPEATPDPATADQPSAGPEGDTQQQDKQEPQAPQQDTPPDPAAPEGEPSDQTTVTDPWETVAKGAAPMSYQMNGQAQTFGSILEVPGKGAIIPADKLEEVRNLVARHESNAHATKELFAYRQEVEALGGPAKYREQAETLAATNAATEHIIRTVLADPTAFVSVVNGQIVRNDHACNLLVKESLIAAREAQWTARTELAAKQQTQTQESSHAAAIESAVPNAVQSFRAVYPTLTDEDFKAAEAMFAPLRDALVYKATPEDAQRYGFPVGTPLVDRGKMQAWFANRAEERARWQEQATKREAAAKENAQRLQQPKPVAKAVPKPARPRDPETGQFTEAKPERKRYSREDFLEAALSGAPTPGTSDD